MAEWSEHKRSGLRSARCPEHGALVVQKPPRHWVWLCDACLAESARAMQRIKRRRS